MIEVNQSIKDSHSKNQQSPTNFQQQESTPYYICPTKLIGLARGNKEEEQRSFSHQIKSSKLLVFADQSDQQSLASLSGGTRHIESVID